MSELLTAEEAVEDVVDQEEVLLETEEVEDNEPEKSDEEVERAKKYGHLSKEDWVAQGRNPNDWKSPEEFNKTGEVIEQIYALRKKIDQRDREIQALVDYQQRTSQREYEKAKQELEQRLAHSKDDMDIEGVAHYTKELVRLQDMEQHSQAQQWQQLQYQAQQNFLERNQYWFNDRNLDLKQRAIEIDNELRNIYPNATYEELAQKIETRMQYEYPDRILGQSTPNRPSVSPSRSSINKTAVNHNSSKKIFQSLSKELKDTYNAHKRIRASLGEELTEVEFIERLKKDGEI